MNKEEIIETVGLIEKLFSGVYESLEVVAKNKKTDKLSLREIKGVLDKIVKDTERQLIRDNIK